MKSKLSVKDYEFNNNKSKLQKLNLDYDELEKKQTEAQRKLSLVIDEAEDVDIEHQKSKKLLSEKDTSIADLKSIVQKMRSEIVNLNTSVKLKDTDIEE